MAALRGSRVSGVMRAPIVDDVLSREGADDSIAFMSGASANVWNVGERCYADAQSVRCRDRDLI